MKVSIITLSFNSLRTLPFTLESISKQTYKNIESIIVDGNSTDGTLKYLSGIKYKNTKIIINKKIGIYNSLNIGIDNCSGDLITILNSDDIFFNKTYIEKIVKIFNYKNVDFIYGDIFYFKKNIKKIVRKYKSPALPHIMIKYGIIPAHTSLVIKKEAQQEVGRYNESLKIAGDFEFFLRLLSKKKFLFYKTKDINIYMRTGGMSNLSIKNRIIAHFEIIQSFKLNKVNFSHFKILLRYFIKILEFRIVV